MSTRVIEIYTYEKNLSVTGYGSTTFKDHRRRKGLEPDECYYVQHADRVIGRKNLDLSVDPPPDLAIEIDVASRSVARQPIYAALGVPEIWRYDGKNIQCFHRSEDGNYKAAEKSLAFPDLPLDLVNELVRTGLDQGQTAAVRAIKQWIRADEES